MRRPSSDLQKLVHRICQAIEENLEEKRSLVELAELVGLSPAHLQRVFKRATGVSPRQYADARRLERLKGRLKEGSNVTAAIYEAGYGSSSRLYEQAGARLGMTPAAYRNGGAGQKLRYSIVDSPLGRMLLAATERGVSAVYFGDSDAQLEAALRKEYPAAELCQADQPWQRYLTPILEHLAGQRQELNLPLDVRATAFQWKVWQALRAIPFGSTSTYSEIARVIGQPDAVRAVGRACASNPVSVVVPCHRVVREDGSLGGYRWGLSRKKQLLQQEAERKGQ